MKKILISTCLTIAGVLCTTGITTNAAGLNCNANTTIASNNCSVSYQTMNSCDNSNYKTCNTYANLHELLRLKCGVSFDFSGCENAKQEDCLPDIKPTQKPDSVPNTNCPATTVPATQQPATQAPATATPATMTPATKKPVALPTTTPVPATEKPSTDNSGSDQSGSNSDSSVTLSESEAFAREVVQLVNVERNRAGLAPLALDVQLQEAAFVRANEIVTSFSHTRPNGSSFYSILKEKNISYRTTGENIAWGQRSAQSVVDGWMNSPGHRANILNSSFGKIGVGHFKSANGTNYWTQLFTN